MVWAMKVAPTVRAAEEDRTAASFDSLAATRNRRPAFGFGGDAVIAPEGFYDPAITNLGQYDLKIGATMPLLDGGTRSRDRARGALGAGAAEADLDRARRDAAIAAATAALDLVRLRELDRAGVETSIWLAELEDLITAGVRAGTRGRGDALRVALERDGVVTFLANTRLLSGERVRELGSLLASVRDSVPPVRDPSPETDRAPTEGDSMAILTAADHAPEVRSAALAAAERDLSLSDAQRRNSPRVDLAVDAGLSGSDLTTLVPPSVKATYPDADFGDRLRRDLGASLALVFRIPFWDTAAAPGTAARQASMRASGLRLNAIRGEQYRLALDLLARWREGSTRLRACQATVQRAEEHVLRSKSLYAAGALTLMELLDARRSFDEARQRLTDARFESRIARFEVEVRR